MKASSASRLGLFYVVSYLGTGVSLPFIATYFHARGLTGAQIGLILALPMLIRPFTGPALAVWADGFTLRRTPMAWLALGAGAGYIAMLAAPGFPTLLLCWLVGMTCLTTLTPLVDVIALRRSRIEGFNYGLPRGAGSAAFIVGNLAMGAILTVAAPSIIPIWITVAVLGCALLAATVVPPDRVHEAEVAPDKATRWKGLGVLLRDRTFLLAVITVGLIQGTHAFYYGFSTLLWRREGISEPMIGVLWGVGVAVEVGFMWFAEPWRRKVGPERLLVLGGAAAAIRWTALAFAPPLWLLFPLQALHALTFAASFMASLRLIERLAPPQSASAAQAINSALSAGFMLGVATLASGPLFDAFGVKGYLVMAVMGGLGLIGALRLTRLAPPRMGA
ncbi:MFS transporter [Caulobacter sp. Root655]|uniref:MFS transporter n=1 Tax=Caulobacter sp. Root655 TaxID=1736578 RepID=UPI000701CF12|nr:MFS transporter [Caulobacter sp. Root655]KRA58441.1 MFS transporter [Caulobacter sp. Root655]